MWKTHLFEIGKDLGLDEPNHDSVVRLIPMTWLPAQINTEVVRQMGKSEEEERAYRAACEAANAPVDESHLVDIQTKHILDILPTFVRSWTLKDPETGDPIDTPAKLVETKRHEILRALPLKLVGEIINKAMSVDSGFGSEELAGLAEAEVKTKIAEAGGNDGVSSMIPLVNESPSGEPSLTVVTTATSSNS